MTRTCHTGAAMASDAHERARKRLEQPSEALLAELIMRDAALRQEAAAGMSGTCVTLCAVADKLEARRS